MSGSGPKKQKQDEDSFWGADWERERQEAEEEEEHFFNLLRSYGRQVWIVEGPTSMEDDQRAFAPDVDDRTALQD